MCCCCVVLLYLKKGKRYFGLWGGYTPIANQLAKEFGSGFSTCSVGICVLVRGKSITQSLASISGFSSMLDVVLDYLLDKAVLVLVCVFVQRLVYFVVSGAFVALHFPIAHLVRKQLKKDSFFKEKPLFFRRWLFEKQFAPATGASGMLRCKVTSFGWLFVSFFPFPNRQCFPRNWQSRLFARRGVSVGRADGGLGAGDGLCVPQLGMRLV